MSKTCSLCPAPAEVALRFHLSTIGMTPRQQECFPGIALCRTCLGHVAAQLCHCVPFALSDPLCAWTGTVPASELKITNNVQEKNQ
jgi:hypothetical protein